VKFSLVAFTFLADTLANFNENVVRAVRRRARAIEFQTAHEAGLHGLDIPDIAL
jgi:hypothetical protein